MDSVKFEIKKEEDDEVTTQLFQDVSNPKSVDNSVAVDFEIKTEEFHIKEEDDPPTYELTTEENNDLFQDQVQFSIIKTDSGPPYQIIDRFANIVIKADPLISTTVDLDRTVTCYVDVVRLGTSKMRRRDEEQNVNEVVVKLKCNDCGKCFPGKRQLSEHMRIHKSRKINRCQHCKKSFGSNYYFKGHMMKHEGKKPFECQVCKKAYVFKQEFKRHMMIHEEKKAYECQLCNKAFTYNKTLKRHMLIHESKKAYECQLCKKVFTYKRSLKKHMSTHKCRQCKKTFGTNFHLKLHMLLIHQGKKALECPNCNESCGSRHYLRQHMLTCG